MLKISNILNNTQSLSDIIKTINNGGTYLHNSESIAAQYAYESQKESGYTIDKESIYRHLDVLIDNGALFNYKKSVEIAEFFIKRGY